MHSIAPMVSFGATGGASLQRVMTIEYAPAGLIVLLRPFFDFGQIIRNEFLRNAVALVIGQRANVVRHDWPSSSARRYAGCQKNCRAFAPGAVSASHHGISSLRLSAIAALAAAVLSLGARPTIGNFGVRAYPIRSSR